MDLIVKKLKQTFEDKVFSRSEKREIKSLLKSYNLDKSDRDKLRHEIFKLAKNAQRGVAHNYVLDWLETANKLLLDKNTGSDSENQIFFSPGNSCLNAILDAIGSANSKIDVCIFTLSDDRIANKLLYCQRKGIKIRILTDNEKYMDLGSDIERLAKAGIPVKVDKTRHHMHHKFAIFDDELLLTGSYNWTRSAEKYNHENIILIDDKASIKSYQNEFNKLWKEMLDF